MTTGITQLNTVRQFDLTRPEIDDIKVRIHRLETQELPNHGYPFAWTVTQGSFTIPANQALILPYLEIAAGHTVTLGASAVLLLIG